MIVTKKFVPSTKPGVKKKKGPNFRPLKKMNDPKDLETELSKIVEEEKVEDTQSDQIVNGWRKFCHIPGFDPL